MVSTPGTKIRLDGVDADYRDVVISRNFSVEWFAQVYAPLLGEEYKRKSDYFSQISSPLTR